MGRILAIDYGRQRCGIAATDPLRLSVNPRPVVEPPALLATIEAAYQEGDLDLVVVGRSVHADGTANEVQVDIDAFIAKLKKKLPTLEVAFQDERGSSKEARQLLVAQGVGKKRRSTRGALDSISAGIILERYLRDAGLW